MKSPKRKVVVSFRYTDNDQQFDELVWLTGKQRAKVEARLRHAEERGQIADAHVFDAQDEPTSFAELQKTLSMALNPR